MLLLCCQTIVAAAVAVVRNRSQTRRCFERTWRLMQMMQIAAYADADVLELLYC